MFVFSFLVIDIKREDEIFSCVDMSSDYHGDHS